MNILANGVVLLVEDDPNDALLVQRAFRKANILNALHVVRDGEEAVSYLRGEAPFADRAQFPIPGMILQDLKLPRKSGLEVLAWLREQPGLKRLPVVMLTSSKQPSDINRAYELGANSYLVKPVAFDALVEMIKTLDLYWFVLNEKPQVPQS